MAQVQCENCGGFRTKPVGMAGLAVWWLGKVVAVATFIGIFVVLYGVFTGDWGALGTLLVVTGVATIPYFWVLVFKRSLKFACELCHYRWTMAKEEQA